jgi:hypothetical protein
LSFEVWFGARLIYGRWVYLFFFNTLWVWIPMYAIYVAYKDICNAFDVRTVVIVASEEQKKDGKKESKKLR